MHHQRLLISWRIGGVRKLEQSLVPLDLRILDRSEHLAAQTLDAHTLNLRLDWTDRVTPVNE